MATKILAFAGSTRKDSFNKKLAAIAAAGARKAGAEVKLIDLKDFPMPLYDGDLEVASGLPESAVALKKLIRSHDGILISSAEYNSSFTAVLKNAIDWASRSEPGSSSGNVFSGKVGLILSASPGPLGGLRGLFHLRQVLTTLNVLVLPEQKAISKANEAFDANGNFTNPKDLEAVEGLASRLVAVAQKLAAS